jgi:hypothetical protein
MSAITRYAIVSASGASASWRMHPRVEKSSGSNDQYGERGESITSIEIQTPRRASPTVSRNETDACEPAWNGSRLSAPFVAQVLGQYMAQNETVLAPATYRGETKVFSALLCDRLA